MKALFIMGIILLIGSVFYGASLTTKNAVIAPNSSAEKTIRYGILTGFALMIISGVLYLKS